MAGDNLPYVKSMAEEAGRSNEGASDESLYDPRTNPPTSVAVQPDAHCYCFTVSGHLDTDSIVALLSAMASRGHLDICAVHGLQQMSRDLRLCASITGEILKGEPCVHVAFEGPN